MTERNAEPNERALNIMSSDGCWLSGTLRVPENPTSLAVFLHGGYLQDRDGNLGEDGNWMYPEGVSRRDIIKLSREALWCDGVGSYCFDKRASGRSEGIFAHSDLNSHARDALAVVAKMRELFPRLPIGIFGHSTAALTFFQARTMGLEVEWTILAAPVISSPEETYAYHKTHDGRLVHRDASGVFRRLYPLEWALYQAVYDGGLISQADSTNDTHRMLEAPGWQALFPLDFFRQARALDFPGLLGKTTAPLGILVGTRDGGTDPELIARLDEMMKEVGRSNVHFRYLKDHDHQLSDLGQAPDPQTKMRPVSKQFLAEIRALVSIALSAGKRL